MAKRFIDNIKLGAFVLAGLLFLILLLYMIGKNRSLFGETYVLKARFENIHGLVAGNNVRFSGIQAGTVKSISVLNDTIIELTMIIDKKMQRVIRRNAIVSIGTEGLVGNKVVNIVPSHPPQRLAADGEMLVSKKAVDTDEMLQVLYKTNYDVAVIASGLKGTVQRINNSSALWSLLGDSSMPKELRISIANIRVATARAGDMADDLQSIVNDVKDGKGSVGTLLRDTSFEKNLNEGLLKVIAVGNKADSLADEISKVVQLVHQEVHAGKGPVNALLKDSMMVMKLNMSLDNIQQGTDKFNQNMEALKHNVLIRGYFKKIDRQVERHSRQQATTSSLSIKP